MGTVADYFLGLQNHCRWWLQPWNKKMLAPLKKSYDKTRQPIKEQRHYFAFRLVKTMVFPVVMIAKTWPGNRDSSIANVSTRANTRFFIPSLPFVKKNASSLKKHHSFTEYSTLLADTSCSQARGNTCKITMSLNFTDITIISYL